MLKNRIALATGIAVAALLVAAPAPAEGAEPKEVTLLFV